MRHGGFAFPRYLGVTYMTEFFGLAFGRKMSEPRG